MIQSDKKTPTQPSRGILKYISEVWLRYRKEKWASHEALDTYSVGASKWLLSPLPVRGEKLELLGHDSFNPHIDISTRSDEVPLSLSSL